MLLTMVEARDGSFVCPTLLIHPKLWLETLTRYPLSRSAPQRSDSLIDGSVHPKVVRELLGHSNISMTMDVYSHVLPSMQQDAISRLNTALGKHAEDGKNDVQA